MVWNLGLFANLKLSLNIKSVKMSSGFVVVVAVVFTRWFDSINLYSNFCLVDSN